LTFIRDISLQIIMFSVNESEYRAKMEQYASKGQNLELSLREISKRRQMTSAKIRLVCSCTLLLPTAGMTTVGILLARWRRKQAEKKYKIIVEAMQKHNIKMPKHHTRDWAVPLAVNLTVYIVTFGMIWGLDHVFSEAAVYMMPYGYVPLNDVVNVSGTAAAEQFIASPDLFVQGVLHGGEGTLEFMGTAATQNMGGVINDLAINATPLTEPVAYLAGEEVGSSVVVEMARKTVASPFGRLMNVRRKVD
jgi:hypothetical protein